MATTVNNAFAEFMRDIVNLDPDVVSEARTSRDNLLDNIAEFDNKDGFFDLCDSFNVHFGSFARKTKCRDLDDVDLMIGIAANGATYYSDDPWDEVRKLICILSWLTPLAEYTYSVCKDVFESISILRKINSFCDQNENKLSGDNVVSVKQELIDLQYKIRERREVGFLIPDWFYKMRKGKHQKQEDSIAETIVNLNQENGEQR